MYVCIFTYMSWASGSALDPSDIQAPRLVLEAQGSGAEGLRAFKGIRDVYYIKVLAGIRAQALGISG